MPFLHAGILAAGLAAVALPVLIHLLMRRRRQPVPWAAMLFVMQAFRRTRRRLLIQRWLLLATRCLLVAAVALALGRPLLGSAQARSAGGRTVYLLIDDTIASALVHDGRPALDRHLDTARRILQTLDSASGDRAGVILLSSPAQPLIAPATTALAAVEAALADLAPTDAAPDWPGAVAALRAALAEPDQARDARRGQPAPEATAVLLSDFRAGSADLQRALPTLPAALRLLASSPPAPTPTPPAPSTPPDPAATPPAPAPTPPAPPAPTPPGAPARDGPAGASNTALVGLEPLRRVLVAGEPGLPSTAQIALARSGADAGRPDRVAVALAWSDPDGTPLGTAGAALIDLPPGARRGAASVALEPPPAAGAAAERTLLLTASIAPDRLSRDDALTAVIQTRAALRVGVVSQTPSGAGALAGGAGLAPAQWLALALRPVTAAGSVQVIDLEPLALDTARLAGLDAALVVSPDRVDERGWANLRAFVDAGGLCLIAPPPGATVQAWPDAARAALSLPLSWAREPLPEDPPAPLAAPPAAAAGAPAGPGATAQSTSDPADAPDLLAAIGPDLPELAQAVTLLRRLPITLESSAPTPVPTAAPSPSTRAGTAGAAPESPADAQAAPRPRVLLQTQAGAPAIVVTRPTPAAGAAPGRGLVVALSFAPDLTWTDLPAKPLMVPLWQELVRQGVSRAQPAAEATAGQPLSLPQNTAELVRLAGAAPPAPSAGRSGAAPRIATDRAGGAIWAPRQAGVWSARDAAGGERAVIAVRPAAAASDVTPQLRAAVEAWILAAVPAPAGDAGAPRGVAWLGPDAAQGAGSNPSGPASAQALRAAIAGAVGGSARGTPTGPDLLLGALALALIELALARLSSPRLAAATPTHPEGPR